MVRLRIPPQSRLRLKGSRGSEADECVEDQREVGAPRTEAAVTCVDAGEAEQRPRGHVVARPTQSIAEERRQDSWQVGLSTPERVTAFPDHDVGIETVGQLLEEASPLGVHAGAHHGGCRRFLG